VGIPYQLVNKEFTSSGVSHIQGQWLARSAEGTGGTGAGEGKRQCNSDSAYQLP
jgi:hypothetical protein